ncbi:putative translationally controlled tumor protein [Monocercomonoides exilis]|uniref:putative translationally controlled tumor protein n=1 Tax=Monocercomonoides exilis TaxID=2049356 RepID=UPI00355A44C8|nr:putative translationally controlled tumor protein [Monocercomonoides exilis]|eukprot:MONOS_13581.1-p1 / transcript=MONOS_13581.1 / gene=MONOS_13581 / organism=Monocercomonoides_exilis_PA203 / gene_product=AaceriABR075Cp / transcript_product=AaceriABR075Cp / location=Mono_scaffold00849:8765-9456(-) / protein_length=167 / sequence_SO=supercontig / SO=protein_coding / is_pseudo=false
MIIYKDIFTGDELCSDAFPNKMISSVVMEVEAKMVQEGGETFDIGANPAEGSEEEAPLDDVKMVNNVISAFHLEETPFDKKSYMTYIKAYMKRVRDYLQEHNPDRVAGFMADIQVFVKDVLSRFDDFQFFTGESMDSEAMVALMFYKEDGITPYFYFFRDGLKEEKF